MKLRPGPGMPQVKKGLAKACYDSKGGNYSVLGGGEGLCMGLVACDGGAIEAPARARHAVSEKKAGQSVL